MSLTTGVRAGAPQLSASRRHASLALLLLVGLSVVSLFVGVATGAAPIAPARVLEILLDGGAPEEMGRPAYDANLILNIRLPRVVLGFEVGAALAVSGALMQGLFRNPLADPALIGVSSGAGLAAAASIVLGGKWMSNLFWNSAALPVSAFLGGLASTSFIYAVSTREGRTSVATMLLAGVGFGAFCGALTGLLAYWSNDQQLRDLTFWSLGSLNGATWSKATTITPGILPLAVLTPLLGKSLNALALGESEAFHLGVRVQLVKTLVIALVALAVGLSVATAGVIGFVGIVAPHTIRLLFGPDNRLLLPAAALLGGAALVGADSLARTLVAPAELPIGVITSAIGAPFFLWLLLSRSRGMF
ncbi:FecCD family ABC transporter permease [Methylocystis parvus]|uniref:Iron ABC transporter permease n=1 Tax=Methylocystis parvus TaxID=134 RepID=A0A6B8M2Z9_9HYPH|nr:iron ABC transporter permease [Methylocystis parvus]QGM96715.1 iron ABC transporter permease [Methylocystis parvus]WBJ99419.1 iron ABC transporter permease [Methylocystis parvus OBBP]